MKDLFTLVLSGGSGTRLWPLSSVDVPKQFIPIFDNNTLFDLTLQRSKILSKNPPIIVSSKKYKNEIEKNINVKNKKCIRIFEETGRNTSAAVWFGARKAYETNPNSYLIIMPSDHFISNNSLFKNKIVNSIKYLNKFKWILFGIKPTFPATGYGYIETKGKNYVNKVQKFIEKPSKTMAKELLKKNLFLE